MTDIDTLRLRVRNEAAARYASLVTEPVIHRAADLLADLLAAGDKHGVQPGHWEVRLADAALDAITNSLREGRPPTAEAALPLLDAFADRLTELGQPVRHHPGLIEVRVPRLPACPVRYPLVVTLAYTGWDITPDTGHVAPVVGVYAPFDVEGARAVADVVAALNRGERGNPFVRS